MTATDELLPCPFCGGNAHVAHCMTCGYDSYWVECDNRIDCGCKVEPVTDVKAIAIMKWNRRAKPSQPTHRDELVDYLCDMCANDCDERKVIRVGQGAYDVCERWKESDHD